MERRKRAWLMLMVTSGAFLLTMFQRQMGGSIQQVLTENFGITATQFSIFGSIFFYSYMIMQLVIGVLIDHIGPRVCVSTGLAITTVGCALMAIAEDFILLCAARLIIGIGVSYGVVAVNKMAVSWFPSERVGSAIGIANIPGGIGSAFAQTGMAWLIATFSWNMANWMITAVFAAYGILCFWVLRDAPDDRKRTADGPLRKAKPNKSTKAVVAEFFKNPRTYPVLVMGIAFNGTVMLFANWSIAYFRSAFRIENVEASSLASVSSFVSIVGILAVTQIAEKINSRKKVCVAAFALGVFSWSMFVFGSDLMLRSRPLLILVLVVYGFHNVCMPLIFCAGQEVNDPQYVGTSVGLCNFISTMGCIAVPMAAGVIIDRCLRNGMTELAAYQICFKFALLMVSIGAIAALVMTETGCRNIYGEKIGTK